MNKLIGQERYHGHLPAGSNQESNSRSRHYVFTRKPKPSGTSELSNYFPNSSAFADRSVVVHTMLPVLFEGSIQTMLRLFSAQCGKFSLDAAFRLSEQLRDGLNLPGLSSSMLNKARAAL